MRNPKAEISVYVLNTERERVTKIYKRPISIHGFDSVMYKDSLWPVYRDVENGFNYIVVPTELLDVKVFTHDKFTAFKDLTLNSFITQSAIHNERGLVKFGMMLPNIHGLIKLIMQGDEDTDNRAKVFEVIQSYQSWAPHEIYEQLNYDPVSNFWGWKKILGGLTDSVEALRECREFIINQVQCSFDKTLHSSQVLAFKHLDKVYGAKILGLALRLHEVIDANPKQKLYSIEQFFDQILPEFVELQNIKNDMVLIPENSEGDES